MKKRKKQTLAWGFKFNNGYLAKYSNENKEDTKYYFGNSILGEYKDPNIEGWLTLPD